VSPAGRIEGRPGQEISSEQVQELEGLDLDYWWYAVRRGWVDAELDAAARSGPLDYLDFGCGTAVLTERFSATHRPARALGIDGTDEAVALARGRGVPVRAADFRRPLELPFRPNVITSLDVLEHLEDPVGALSNLAAAAAPGAHLVVTVPAMPSLFSRWDELSGHHRRYTRKLLRRHLEAAGWRVLRIRYLFSYCVPPAWVERRLLRRVQEFEFPEVSPTVNRAMRLAGTIERRLGAPLPFGTSLFATARAGAGGAVTER